VTSIGAFMKIGIYLYDECLYSSVIALCDLFDVANKLALKFKLTSSPKPLFETELISWDSLEVKTSNSRPLQAESFLSEATNLDLLIIPGVMDHHEITIPQGLEEKLRDLYQRGTLLCSICAGSYFLAKAGVLDGKKATSHWNLIRSFEILFPEVQWLPNQLLVKEEGLISCGGVSSYQELGLDIITSFGSAELAKYCSNFMLIEPGRNHQAPYQMALFPKNHLDEPILELQNWIELEYSQPISLDSMLNKVPLTQRTLMRRFKNATGYTPLGYLQEQRLFKAKALLEFSDHSFEEITWKVGYENPSSFSRLFKKRIGLTPGTYRTRFCRKAP
jgi:transcriptional regulator GlxA family with amidase domain